MFDGMFLNTMFLTLKLALLTTIILLFISIPIVYVLLFKRSNLTSLYETILTMPIVLPPSVIGFYILIIFSPKSTIGNFLVENFDFTFAFTFEGIVLASVIFSIPFMVNPIFNAAKNVPQNLIEASYSLGKSQWTTYIRVVLPNVKGNILAASAITFAHVIGEFGIVFIVGGNIPNETKVASIAIYEELETLNYGMAHKYSITIFSLSFLMLLIVYLMNKRLNRS
ncbi:MAG: molybdate ABC transporter permease subunit [Calditerrivibrio sp.]|nr:molybdate ABC transporter permease subunit [Calditerrivibrio sp.]